MLGSLGQIFNTLFIEPTLNVLVIFYSAFASIGLPGAFGFSIIAITILIRTLMHPFFKKQMHTAKKMRDIKPRLDVLKKKHEKDPQQLQKAQLELYKEAGINPASGCLFAIVQMPLIFGLYQVLRIFLEFDKNGASVKIKEINDKLYFNSFHVEKLDPHFFMFNLALTPATGGAWYYFLIPFVTAGLQFWQSKVTMTQNPMTDISTEKVDDKDKKKGSDTQGDFQKAMNTQMKYFFPLMIGYFSYTLPVGLSIYWNTFSLFSIIQHYMTDKKDR